MGLEYYWKLLRKSWTISFLGRHVTFGFWINILTDRVLPETGPSADDTTTYHYEPLNQPGLIRIFKLLPGDFNDPIKGTLIHNTENIPYEALSYIWGDSSHRAHIELNKHPWSVTRNLEIALRHLRLPDIPRILWIDALCINQKDTSEVNIQVRQMLNIYHHARLVDIWLGPSSSSSESRLGMQILSFLAGNAPLDQAPWILMPEQPFHLGFQDVIARDWFQRMWVVQEAAVSRHATMICGSSHFSWSGDVPSVRRFLRRLKLAAISPQWEQVGLAGTNPGSFLQVLNLQMQHLLRTERQESQTGESEGDGKRGVFPTDILDVAFELRHRKAGDRRDKLFSILGLVDEGTATGFEPDYNMNVEEVFERLLEVVEL